MIAAVFLFTGLGGIRVEQQGVPAARPETAAGPTYRTASRWPDERVGRDDDLVTGADAEAARISSSASVPLPTRPGRGLAVVANSVSNLATSGR